MYIMTCQYRYIPNKDEEPTDEHVRLMASIRSRAKFMKYIRKLIKLPNVTYFKRKKKHSPNGLLTYTFNFPNFEGVGISEDLFCISNYNHFHRKLGLKEYFVYNRYDFEDIVWHHKMLHSYPEPLLDMCPICAIKIIIKIHTRYNYLLGLTKIIDLPELRNIIIQYLH